MLFIVLIIVNWIKNHNCCSLSMIGIDFGCNSTHSKGKWIMSLAFEVWQLNNEVWKIMFIGCKRIINIYLRQHNLFLFYTSLLTCHLFFNKWSSISVARMFKNFVNCTYTYSINSKIIIFQALFTFGIIKKSNGERSGKYGGLSCTKFVTENWSFLLVQNRGVIFPSYRFCIAPLFF